MLEKSISLSSITKEDTHKLFIDFKNDKSLFEREEDYKEYKYNSDEVDNYVSRQTNKGYILLSISYNGDVIGEIRFKGAYNYMNSRVNLHVLSNICVY